MLRKHSSQFVTGILVILSLMAVFGIVQSAAPPNIVTYQGRVLDSNGVPVSDSSLTMKFFLYDASTSGTCLWSNSSADCDSNTPASTTGRSVTLTSGLFTENLGDTSNSYAAIADSVFGDNTNIYLEVDIAGETLTPRKQLTAAPYAMNAQRLDGIDSTGFLASTGDTGTGVFDFSGATLSGASPFVFEGATADDFESTFAFTDPTGDNVYTFKDSSGTIAFTSDVTSVWESTSIPAHVYEDDSAVVIGANTSFTYASGGVGDLQIVDELEVMGDGFIDNDLVIGASTSSTETLSNTSFTLGGDDLFVAGTLGVEGSVYTDDTFSVGTTTSFGAGAITTTGSTDLALTIAGGDLTFAQNTTIGDGGDSIAINTSDWDISATGDLTGIGTITTDNDATIGADLIVTSGARIGTGSTPDSLTALADDSFFVEGALEIDGATRFDSTIDINGVPSIGADITFDATTPNVAINNGESLTITDGTNTLFTLADAGTTGNLTLSGDLTISGDDLTMGTNTSGFILVADGTNYNPVDLSGDVDVSSAGVATIASNAVALGTDTTGNYVATVADAGNGTVTVVGSGSEGAPVTLDVVDVNCNDCLDFAVLSDTLGLDASTSITMDSDDQLLFTNNGTGNIIFDLASTGDLVIRDNGTDRFTASDDGSFTFDGLTTFTANANVESDLTVVSGARIGSGSTPDSLTALADDTLFVEGALEVDGATRFDSTIDINGVPSIGADITFDATTPNIAINNTEVLTFSDGTNTLLTLTDMGTTGNLETSGDLKIAGDDLYMGTNTSGFILVADGTNYNPVDLSGDVDVSSAGVASISADAVTLGTDTTGDYVATIADAGNNTISVSGSGAESATVTIDAIDLNCADCLDFDKLSDTLTLDASTSIAMSGDTTFAFTSNGTGDAYYNLQGTGDFIIQDGGQDAFRVYDTGGLAINGDTLFTLSGTENIELTNTSATANVFDMTVTAAGHDASQILLTLGNDGDADTVNAIDIGVTSEATGDSDTLRAINIQNLTNPDATVTEHALAIGSGWDVNLLFNDTTSNIDIADTGVFTFREQGGANTLMTLTDNSNVGDLALTGDLNVTGSATVGSIVCADCFDFTEFSDTLALDASTSITLDGTDQLLVSSTGSGNVLFNLANSGDFIIQDDGSDRFTAADDGTFTFDGAVTFNTDATYALAAAENLAITNTSATATLFDITATSAENAGQAINFTLGNDANVDTVAALDLNLTSASTGDADELQGISLELAGADATVDERALVIGSGWDIDLSFRDSTPVIRVLDTGVITWAEGGGANTLMTLTDNADEGDLLVTGDITADDFICTDCLDFTELSDSLSLDASTTITGAADEVLTINRTLTDQAAENGVVISVTASNNNGNPHTSQNGLVIENAASTDGLGAGLLVLNSDTDDYLESGISLNDGANANGFAYGLDISNADPTNDIRLQDGATMTNSGAGSFVFDFNNNGTSTFTIQSSGSGSADSTALAVDSEDDTPGNAIFGLSSDAVSNDTSIFNVLNDGSMGSLFGNAANYSIDATTTDSIVTNGIIDLNVDAGNAAVDGLNIDIEAAGTITAGTDITAIDVLLTATDTDADLFGLTIGTDLTAGIAGSYEAGILISNADNTAASMTDAISITSSTAGGTVDGVDASQSNIVNAFNAGDNFVLLDGTRFFSSSSSVITFEDTSGNDLMTLTDNANEGDLVATGDITADDFICTDCLDFTEFGDALALDASTSIAMDGDEEFLISNGSTGGVVVDLTSTGDFIIRDNGGDYFTLADDRSINYATNQTTTDAIDFTANALTTGTAIDLTVNNITSGDGIRVSSNSGALSSGSLLDLDHTATYSTDATLSGSTLGINRVLTTDTGGQTLNVTAAVATLGNTGTQTAGTLTDVSNILALVQNYASASGEVLDIINAGTGSGIFIDQNGNGAALSVDSEATNVNLMELKVANTSGGVIDLGWDGATTQAGNITGLDLDFNTNLVVDDGNDLVGIAMNLDELTANGAGSTSNITGFTLSGGHLDSANDASAQTIGWGGLNINLPDLDTGDLNDTTTSYGIRITGGSITNGAGLEDEVGIDVGGTKIDLDADNDTSILASNDDQIVVEVGGTNEFIFDATSVSPAAVGVNDLGSDTNEWNQLFLGDNNTAIQIGTDQAATLGIDTGSDALEFIIDGGSVDYVSIGNASNVDNLVASDGDLLVNDQLEVNGASFFDSIVTIGPTGPGTFLDFAPTTAWTSGDMINLDWGSSTTATGNTIGVDLDFSNYTANGTNLLAGIHLNDPASATGSAEYGLYIQGANWDRGIYSENSAEFRDFVYIGVDNPPAIDILTVDNDGQANVTDGVSGISVQYDASNVTASAMEIDATYTGGPRNNMEFSMLALANTAPTNAAGTDKFVGISIGNMTDPGATITSAAMKLGTGWDQEIVLSQTEDISQPSDDIIRFSGNGGSNDQDIDFVLDQATNPIISSPTATSIQIDEQLIVDLVAVGATQYAVCHTNSDTNDEPLGDCSGAPTADYAEMYPAAEGVDYGHLVVPGEKVVTTDDPDHGVQQIREVVLSSEAYQGPVIGIVSNNYGDFTSAGYNVDEEDNPMPVALVGRVPVKVTAEGGPISSGDYLTTSSTPGAAMKATKVGRVIGMALNDWDGQSDTLMVQVNNSWSMGDVLGTDGISTLVTDNVVVSPLGEATAEDASFSSYGLALRGSAWNGSEAEAVEMMLQNVVDDSDTYRLSVRNTAETEVAYITNEGTMRIAGDMVIGGNLYPTDRGTPQTEKYIYYDGSEGAGGDFMRTNAKGWSTGSYDFAEMFPSAQDLTAGELVAFSGEGEQIQRATGTEGEQLVGIISTRPGFLAGENVEGAFPVALAGRVPARVSTEGGAISVGDPLTISSSQGIAMKATESGIIVGYALEAYDGGSDNLILTYVNLSYWAGEATSITPGTDNRASGFASSGTTNFTSLNMSGNIHMGTYAITGIGRLEGLTDTWSIEQDGTIATRGLIKNVMENYQGEPVETVAVTSPEVVITLSGTAELKDGQAEVRFEQVAPEYNDVISADAPIRVVVTPNGPVSLYVSEKDQNHFIVKRFAGEGDVTFDWMVTAYRRGYEPEPVAEEDVEVVEEEEVVADSSSDESGEQILPEPVEGVGEEQEEIVEETVEEPVSETDLGEPADLTEAFLELTQEEEAIEEVVANTEEPDVEEEPASPESPDETLSDPTSKADGGETAETPPSS